MTATAAPSTVTVAARPRDSPVLRHHEPHRELEHEREEDADEDDQEGVADGHERRHHGERGNHEHDRPQRQHELHPTALARLHAVIQTDPQPGRHRPDRMKRRL